MPRFDPPPTISSGCSSAAAHEMMSHTWRGSLTRKTSVTSGAPLEARQFGEAHLSAMHMHAAEFRAAVENREHFAGVQQPARIERAFQPLLLRQIGFVEHRVHQVALLDPDAVLARQHPA